MAGPDAEFLSVLTAFRNRLTQKELADFKFTSLEDVRDVIGKIQRQQETQKEMMNMTRIQSFLEAMEQFGKTVEVFLNVSDAVAFVWGPVKFLLQVASTWAYSFDRLLEAYQQIGERIPLLQQYYTLFEQEPEMRKVLKLLFQDILEFHQRALKFFSDKVWRQLFRSMWSDFKTRFDGILMNLSRHGHLIETQASLLHMARYENHQTQVFDQLLSLNQNLQQANAQLTAQELKSENEKYLSVLEWVAAPIVEHDHEFACQTWKQSQCNGSWILQKPKVVQWIQEDCPDRSLLWMHGIPGAGKTILASMIIEECKKVQQSTTAFFYCKHDDPGANTCISILKGILRQQVSQNRDITPYFYDWRYKSSEPVLSLEKTAKQMIEIVCQRGQRQYIILDGLDECPIIERRAIISLFNALTKTMDTKDPGKLRVMIVSQNESDIRKEMNDPEVLEITPDDNKDDIEKFVWTWAAKIGSHFGLNQEQMQHIKDKTCSRASGQFLYADLVMKNLFAQINLKELRAEVDESRFPKKLSEAYERIVVRIRRNTQPEEWEIAKRLLGWMVCAARPLKWHEIQAAISIDVEEATVKFDDLRLRRHIHDICGSLVRIHNNERVTLVHNTAQEFIASSPHIDKPAVEYSLAALCLNYLTFDCFNHDTSDDELEEFVSNAHFAFADYAVAKWPQHFRAAIAQFQDRSHCTDSPNQQHSLQDLEEALDCFYGDYGDDIDASTEQVTKAEIAKQVPSEIEQLSLSPEIIGRIRSIWLHLVIHQQKGHTTQNEISLTKLSSVVRRVRDHIEANSGRLSAEKEKHMIERYGDRWFKCSKVTCHYFHEGFKDAKTRQEHVNRHDRPFRCDVPDCQLAVFGFASEKDRKNHARMYHADEDMKSKLFPSAPEPPKKVSKHFCAQCNKTFSRYGILKTHRLTHTGERPHECSYCGKAFTRKNDCQRHEKQIHQRS